MPGPFDLENPSWDHKQIGDKQTAVEMNDVMNAFKGNVPALIALIQLIDPGTALHTVAQKIVPAINELVSKNATWLTLPDRSIAPYPPMTRGQMKIIRTTEIGGTDYNPGGWATLGGANGIKVGAGALLICMQDSPGGDHATVGYRYALNGNSVGTPQIIPVADYGSLPAAQDVNPFALYLVLDTGDLYYWDSDLEDYVLSGSILEGELIDSTTFEVGGTPVIPDGLHIYKDTNTGIYYVWNGFQFVQFENNGNTAQTVWDSAVKLEDTYPELGILTDVQRNQKKFNDAILPYATDRRNFRHLTYGECEQNDDVKTAFDFDMLTLKESFILTMTGNTTFTCINIPNNFGTFFSFYLEGNYAPTFPGMTREDASDDYDKGGLNRIWVDVAKGTSKTIIRYSITNLD